MQPVSQKANSRQLLTESRVLSERNLEPQPCLKLLQFAGYPFAGHFVDEHEG